MEDKTNSKRLNKAELLERCHKITDLLVRISGAYFPCGRPSAQDETAMPYWADEALIQYTKLVTDVLHELDWLHAANMQCAMHLAKDGEIPKAADKVLF
jgi:hypothetical protein